MSDALEGIVILDLTAYIAGPYGTALLGDVGAEIIKIEAPGGGDALRQYPSSLKDESRAFLGVNRNKRSIVLNLKSNEGRTAFYRLVEQADVVVHNFRPSVPPSLGIDYETLRAHRADLIYCSMTGYGESGPLRDHPGYDTMLQCFTGMAFMQGGADQPEILRGSMVDYYAASMVALGISSALIHRLRTGEGQHVEVSLLRSALALQAGRYIWAKSEPRVVDRDWGASWGKIYPAKEGFLFLQAPSPTFWKNLCETLGFPDLTEDPRYDSVKKRHDRSSELIPIVAKALKRHTAVEWEQLMHGKVPCIVVRKVEEMFDHPQVLAEGIVAEHEHPIVGKYLSLRTAVKMGIGYGAGRRAPMLGEHTDEVLARFGFRTDEIAELHASGAAS